MTVAWLRVVTIETEMYAYRVYFRNTTIYASVLGEMGEADKNIGGGAKDFICGAGVGR
jgi:hypothetical protein